ncbi:hypothetical protein YIM1640_21860 [Thermus oshimai]|uniref:nucleotidyltransferase domain-containing protein n=1 Tax=Thermus TaxID=270 RepID=UPI0030AB8F6C
MDREAYERWLAQAKHTLASAEEGHSLKRLLSVLEGAGVAIPPEPLESAQELDIHYLPARYPEGSPFEFYNAKRAREALLEEARAYAKRVREALGEAEVYLFGSVARGDFNLESDLDLLVVSPALPQDPLERARLLREEPRGLLPEEFARLRAKGGLWFLEGALRL